MRTTAEIATGPSRVGCGRWRTAEARCNSVVESREVAVSAEKAVLICRIVTIAWLARSAFSITHQGSVEWARTALGTLSVGEAAMGTYLAISFGVDETKRAMYTFVWYETEYGGRRAQMAGEHVARLGIGSFRARLTLLYLRVPYCVWTTNTAITFRSGDWIVRAVPAGFGIIVGSEVSWCARYTFVWRYVVSGAASQRLSEYDRSEGCKQ